MIAARLFCLFSFTFIFFDNSRLNAYRSELRILNGACDNDLNSKGIYSLLRRHDLQNRRKPEPIFSAVFAVSLIRPNLLASQDKDENCGCCSIMICQASGPV